jgi:hypothetical protein
LKQIEIVDAASLKKASSPTIGSFFCFALFFRRNKAIHSKQGSSHHIEPKTLPMNPVKDPEQYTRVRERQWIYLGPILAAPLAHIGVTLYRSAKTARQRQLLVAAIVGSTLSTIGMRLALMHHAGYPGGTNAGMADRERLVPLNEKREIENPSMGKILREAFRGFG